MTATTSRTVSTIAQQIVYGTELVTKTELDMFIKVCNINKYDFANALRTKVQSMTMHYDKYANQVEQWCA